MGPGDVVTGRPRIAGRRAAPRRGIILDVTGDSCVVWFRSMGLTPAVPASVQLLPLVDVTDRTHVTRLAPGVITAIYRECAGVPAASELRRVIARHLLGAG